MIFIISFIVDTNEIELILTGITSRVNNIQNDLDNIKNSPTDSTSEDRFAETMEVIEILK